MSFAAAKEQLSALTPAGRQWIEGQNEGESYLELVPDGQELELGVGVIRDGQDNKPHLLLRVVVYAAAFEDEEVDEPMVLDLAAKELAVLDGLACDYDVIVYDGRTGEDGQWIPVPDDEQGAIDVEAFEVLFSPDLPIDQLDEDLLKKLIEGAPYILPSEE